MSSAEGVASYLANHPPFQSMSEECLADLASAASTHTFGTGELVVDYTEDVPDEIWMLRSGHVALLADSSADAEPVDSIAPGGVFGIFPLLTDGQVKFTARATEPSTLLRLPGSQVREVFAKPEGLSYLASTAWDTRSEQNKAQRPSLTAVGDLIPAEPVFTSAETSVRDAVRHMAARRSSYVLVALPSGELGIFTDHDLRVRVVAAGAGLDVPVGRVMSVPARTVTMDRVASTVLMDMLESGMKHMPVVDHHGRVLGVVEHTDLFASSTRQSFLLRHTIALAADQTELAAAARRIGGLVIDLFRGGTDAAGTSAVLSVVIDAVVRRALDLELADHVGRWRNQFAWLTLGSVARREAMPSSDVDSALSWADDLTANTGLLTRLATGVHSTLDLCGLPADRNGAVASKPRFARSSSGWAEAAARWLDDPMQDRGIVMSSLLLDARVVWGDAELHTVPAAFSRMREEHPNALRLQLLDALSGKPRTWSLRDVVAGRGGTLDLKNHALTPIVNLARWGGLTVGVVSASTPARLEAAAGNGILSESDVTILLEVFELLQRLRMAHQVDQLAAGLTPGDVITMSELSPLSRSLLTDGVREVAAVQRRVRNLALTTAGQGVG